MSTPCRRSSLRIFEAQPVAEPALDRPALLDAAAPAVAARPPSGRMQREQHVAHLLVGDRRAHGDAGALGRLEIASDRLRIESHLRGDALLRQSLAS